MLGSAILDVAIGLVFVYFLLSVVCSAIHEWLAAATELRAQNLEVWIGNLLNQRTSVPQRGEQGSLAWYGKNLVMMFARLLLGKDRLEERFPSLDRPRPERGPLLASFYNHVLIRGTYLRSKFDRRMGRGGSPSYISAFDFTEALLSLVWSTGGEIPNGPVLVKTLRECLQRFGGSPALRATEDRLVGKSDGDILAVSGEVRRLLAIPAELPEASITAKFLRDRLAESRRSPILEAFRALLVGKADDDVLDLDALKQDLARWYDSVMERASGWYKNNTQQWLAVIAVVVTLAANVDSIEISTRLWGDPKLREAVATAAERAVDEGFASPTATTAPAEGSGKAAPATETNSLTRFRQKMHAVAERTAIVRQEFQTLRLPFGWGSDGLSAPPVPLYLKPIGWAITALALTMGAPFWFDILNKFVNVRAAGRRPAGPTTGDQSVQA